MLFFFFYGCFISRAPSLQCPHFPADCQILPWHQRARFSRSWTWLTAAWPLTHIWDVSRPHNLCLSLPFPPSHLFVLILDLMSQISYILTRCCIFRLCLGSEEMGGGSCLALECISNVSQVTTCDYISPPCAHLNLSVGNCNHG